MTWPASVVDLLPQGYGRAEALTCLGRDVNAGPAADWDLLCTTAANPVGNVRVKQAHQWMVDSIRNCRGYTIDEVTEPGGGFLHRLRSEGVFHVTSCALQGDWPKLMLTRSVDGLFYLDHALSDESAVQHFIVKFDNGATGRQAEILRLEAAYMDLARHLGLRVHGRLEHHGGALFIPRFDREVRGRSVIRLGQESIASLCSRSEFGARVSNNEVCGHLGRVCTDPHNEVIEFLKRDIANVVLGNKDNHARNTAIVRREGFIGLTPLFDFAPMWLHSEGISRQGRWREADGGSPTWSSAIAQASEASGVSHILVQAEVRKMVKPLIALPDKARQLGISEEYLAPLSAVLDSAISQLIDMRD